MLIICLFVKVELVKLLKLSKDTPEIGPAALLFLFLVTFLAPLYAIVAPPGLGSLPLLLLKHLLPVPRHLKHISSLHSSDIDRSS